MFAAPLQLYGFPQAFFISKEASTAEWRWEKEGRERGLHICGVQTIARPPPPPPSRCDNGGSLLALHFQSPSPPPPPSPHTPPKQDYKPNSGSLGQNWGRPPFRSLWVWQLNLDSNCDYVRIFGAVIGHLEAEIEFLVFHRKWWKPLRAQRIWYPQRFWQVVLVQQAGTVRERRRP